jgi:hypothetical protein
MLKVPILNAIAGTTLKLTWVNSGVTPSDICMSLLDRDETVVSSASAVSSGNGHYFLPVYVPNSWQWYVAQSIAIVDARTYVNRALVRRWKLEVNAP